MPIWWETNQVSLNSFAQNSKNIFQFDWFPDTSFQSPLDKEFSSKSDYIPAVPTLSSEKAEDIDKKEKCHGIFPMGNFLIEIRLEIA